VRILLLALISLGTYASGVVVAARLRRWKARLAAHPGELLLLLCAFGGICYVRRSHFSPGFFLACAGAMFVLGAIVALLRASQKQQAAGGTREFEEMGQTGQPGSLWKRWLAFSRAIIDYEIRLLLVAAYLVAVGPVAIAFRLFRKEETGGTAASTFIPKSDTPSLENARRSF